MKKLLPLGYGVYFNLLALFSKRKVGKKAFIVFSTIRKGRVLAQQTDFLDSAKHERLEIAEHTIQTYRWAGSGATILLIHGWESNAFRWSTLIGKLTASNYNIIALDAPGHGYSSGKQLYSTLYAAVLQTSIERYRPEILVGHSFGGMIAIFNEYHYANAGIKKIVTIASPSEFHELMAHYQNLLKFSNRVMAALDAYIFERFGYHINDFSTVEFVKTNSTKGLLIHDKEDTITPYHASQKVHANWKESKFISTEGLGHSLHQEPVNTKIVNFLNS